MIEYGPQMGKVFEIVAILVGVTAYAVSPFDDDSRGSFQIESTPYFEAGSVDYEGLKREIEWLVDCGCLRAIRCQSNDAIVLLTTQEKFRGLEVCVTTCENRSINIKAKCK